MIKAFNLAEQYRVPVFFMMDEVVGHMTERVDIPDASEIEVVERRLTKKTPAEYQAYGTDGGWVPDMIKAGDGYRVHITGLTHDERGYPAMTPAGQKVLMDRLLGKIRENREQLIDVRMENMDDAEIVVVSFGITSRVAGPAIAEARQRGLKVGHLRLIITWPFPVSVIKELATRVKAFVVPELNMGQMVLEVERAVAGKVPVIHLPHAGGTVHEPQEILEKILQAAL
jgi:2-oxoglutarate ferredoxin oxidoreductase subunit alpha